jgi:predicted ATP-dependent protease
LVLEQSYSQVDGDSASAGELCALLSALANVGINQSIGITGSVNQRGELQAIGGVNEKIEAFYSLCAARGKLDGSHGVIIPQANVSCLMLNEKVIQAVKESKFSIYAVSDINRAMEILTNETQSKIHQRVDEQLKEFAKTRQEYSK